MAMSKFISPRDALARKKNSERFFSQWGLSIEILMGVMVLGLIFIIGFILTSGRLKISANPRTNQSGEMKSIQTTLVPLVVTLTPFTSRAAPSATPVSTRPTTALVPTASPSPTPEMTATETSTTIPTVLSVWVEYHSGQSFITWTEKKDLEGGQYRVYRSSQAITVDNWKNAHLLAEIGNNSAAFYANRYNMRGTQQWKARYFDRLAIPSGDTARLVPDGTGLLVWTLTSPDFEGANTGNGYYAITTLLKDGSEQFDPGYCTGPIAEAVADPQPVEVTALVTANSGDVGHVYIQFMNLSAWNPTFHAPNPTNAYFGLDPADPNIIDNYQYAYDYQVFIPTPDLCGGKLPSKLPVILRLHGWRGNTLSYQSPYPDKYCAYGIYPVDVTDTWWFGFVQHHDYRKEGSIEAGDVVVNFTEQRLLRMIYDLESNPPGPEVDPERIYVSGQSMGGSGTLALVSRYPNVFAAGYSSQPITDFRTAVAGDNWQADGAIKWGNPDLNLPVSISAPGNWAANLQKYNLVGVWDWQSYQENFAPSTPEMASRRSDDMAPFGITHGLQDIVIDWNTQAQPFYQKLDSSLRTWGAVITNTPHQWAYYQGLPPSIIPIGSSIYDYVPFWGFQVIKDETVPGLSNLSSNPGYPPLSTGNYNDTILWSSSWNDWDGSPIDQPSEWQMSFCSVAVGSTTCGTGDEELVDVTPRRLQKFVVKPGAVYEWENFRVRSGKLTDQGTVTADENGLLTVQQFKVSPTGNRLVLKEQGK